MSNVSELIAEATRLASSGSKQDSNELFGLMNQFQKTGNISDKKELEDKVRQVRRKEDDLLATSFLSRYETAYQSWYDQYCDNLTLENGDLQ